MSQGKSFDDLLAASSLARQAPPRDRGCRRCGEVITAATQRVRNASHCPVCDWHPQAGGNRPVVTEHQQVDGGHVYLIAGDGGWWIVTLPDHDEMLAVDGRAEGERYGAGQYTAARQRARDVAEDLRDRGDA